jgi:DNA-binding NtrC family response regulator
MCSGTSGRSATGGMKQSRNSVWRPSCERTELAAESSGDVFFTRAFYAKCALGMASDSFDPFLSDTLSEASGQRSGRRITLEPYLFVALECDRPLAGSSRHRLTGTRQVLLGRGNERVAVRDLPAGTLTLRVPDRWMSSQHARLQPGPEGWVIEDADSKNGTLVNGVRYQRAVLCDGDLVELGHTLFLFRSSLPTASGDPLDLEDSHLASHPALATFSPWLEEHLQGLVKIAPTGISALITGESGTGKEVAARALHDLSGRPGAFAAINCGAVPQTLIESELFGSKKGAFSGAVDDRPGLVRSADRGTLFLDEIGDLPLSSQAALLRVLQEKEVLPVGGTKPVKVDVRVVAATHRNLEAMVREGQFRQDLYARLAGFTMTLPPLRERREDLGRLVAVLLRKGTPQGRTVRLAIEAGRALYRHEWPLNVRELEQALATATVLASEGIIELSHLPQAVREPEAADETLSRPLSEEDLRLKERLVAAMQAHGGNISGVAREMGKARMQIHRWLRRFQLDPDSFRK